MSSHERVADIQKENNDIPWFTSVDDYHFIDNYKKVKNNSQKTKINYSQKKDVKHSQNEYSNDEFEILFNHVSFLKAKYRDQ